MHGGHALAGIASPHWKHGKYSRALPKHLLENYEAARRDPELLNLSDELALLDSRLLELIGRINTREAGRIWREAQAAWTAFMAAQRRGDADAMASALERVDECLSKGAGDEATWAELLEVVAARRRLAESERKRRIEMEQMLSAEEATALMSYIIASVRRHVDDRSALQGIQSDLAKFWSRST